MNAMAELDHGMVRIRRESASTPMRAAAVVSNGTQAVQGKEDGLTSDRQRCFDDRDILLGGTAADADSCNDLTFIG
jgi:hypothetical protein